MRVNTLLKRDEIEGFESYVAPVSKRSEDIGSVERFGFGIPDEPKKPKAKPEVEEEKKDDRPAPPGGRTKKRYRRAL